MASFPSSLASFIGFVAGHTLLVDVHAAQHNLEQAEILATQTKLGTGSSTPVASTVLRGTGAGTSAWGQVALTTDVTGVLPVGSGGIGQATLTGLTLTTPILTTPVIASFASANHDHSNAAGGGKITSTGITSLDSSLTTLSNPYKFSVYRAAAWTAATNTWGKVTCDTETFDTNNNFASGTYTAPVAGFYLFMGASGSVSNNGALNGTSFYVNGTIHKIGTLQDQVYQAAGTADAVYSATALIKLAAGDTVDMYHYGNAGAGEVGIEQTWFSGILLSQT